MLSIIHAYFNNENTIFMIPRDHRSVRDDCPALSVDDQLELRRAIEAGGILSCINDEAAPLENLLFSSAASTYEFFHSNGYMLLRSELAQKTIAPALQSYVGWVYAFYESAATPIGHEDKPLYVGETGRTFAERFKEHSVDSPRWWISWGKVKVLPCPNQAMRKVFESLIGLAGGYSENKNQPPADDNILDEILLSLLALGNNNNELPRFPNQMISVQNDHLVQLVEWSKKA